MEFKDYYKTLGLNKGADAEAIKKAYRKLAAKYHPDKNPGNKQAEDRFKAINEAHEVLGDPEKKQRYDSFGADWDKQGGAGGGFDFSDFMRRQGGNGQAGASQGFGGGDFSDFFEAMFGGQGGRRSHRGEDFHADFEITLEDAYHGTTKLVEIGGRKVKLKVKPGISEGKSLRLPGTGSAGRFGGEDGDVYLKIRIAPHPLYERRGNDLHRELPVDFLTAVTGSKLEVATLKGPVKVTIPARTDHGKVLRLKGMGMPVYDEPGEFGDLYLKVVLSLPKDLSDEEVKVLEGLAQSRAKA